MKKVRLKVLSGKSAGMEIKLRSAKFVIGRSEGCDLRPRTDAVSRKHCVILLDEETVRIRDLKSRNGTFVNGEQIKEETKLHSGDRIAVGPLQFELLVKTQKTDAPQPVPAAPKAVAASKSTTAKQSKSSGGSGSVADDDIFSWLQEGDEVDREERIADPQTRQYKLDKAANPETETVDMGGGETSGDTTTDATKKKEKEEKKEPLKLPKVPEKKTENSQEAAADALRDFFKRG